MTGAESSLFSPRRDRKPAGVSDIRPRVSLVLQSLLPYPHSCQGTSPHQQGWDTKMARLSFCGIDVSKDRLDVVVLPEGCGLEVDYQLELGGVHEFVHDLGDRLAGLPAEMRADMVAVGSIYKREEDGIVLIACNIVLLDDLLRDGRKTDRQCL